MLGRVGLIGLGVLAALGPSCHAARAPSNVNQEARVQTARVVGRVVDLLSRRPLGGRLVAIGQARAVTDTDGRFVLDGVPNKYDAVVVEPDRATATVYRGLHRRDPLLVHRVHDTNEGTHAADIVGTLTGGGPLEKGDYVIVGFLSRQLSTINIPWVSPTQPGIRPTYPGYGPFRIGWRGADTIAGDLVALLIPGGAPGAPPGSGVGRPPLLAHKKIVLDTEFPPDLLPHEDEHGCPLASPPAPRLRGPTEVPLVLEPVKQKHVELTVEAPHLELLTFRYRWPALDAELGLPSFGPTQRRLPARPIPLELDVPDLGSLGAILCLQAVANNGETATCTFPPNGPARVRTPSAPTLVMPAGPVDRGGHTIFTPATRPSWTRFEGGVHLLRIETAGPSAAHPTVYVLTEETSASWPDLAALGVQFPIDFVMYEVSLVGYGPYATIDAALAPDGIGAAALSDRYRVRGSRDFSVMLSPTGGLADETACGEIPPQACSSVPGPCDCGPGCTCEDPCAVAPPYFLLDIKGANRTLAFHPGLAAAAGVRCVRDCDGLRALRVAFRRYAHEHPGFQENEPLPAASYDDNGFNELLRSIPRPQKP